MFYSNITIPSRSLSPTLYKQFYIFSKHPILVLSPFYSLRLVLFQPRRGEWGGKEEPKLSILHGVSLQLVALKRQSSAMDPQSMYPVDSHAHKPPYIMLYENGVESPSTIQPPPYRRTAPHYPSNHKRSDSACTCLCCLCCCSCIIILIFALFCSFLYALYLTYQPQLPTYEVQGLKVTAFKLFLDFTLHAEFLVTVKASNPNHRISIIYGEDSSVSVVYKGAELCSGSLPAFRQGHLNKTVMEVSLQGDSSFGSGLQEALMDNRESERIPLVLFVKVPVTIVMEAAGIEVGPKMVWVVCNLVVDSLSPNKKIDIIWSDYKVFPYTM